MPTPTPSKWGAPNVLEEQSATELHLEDAQRLNEEYFNEEQEKLERWAEDSK